MSTTVCGIPVGLEDVWTPTSHQGVPQDPNLPSLNLLEGIEPISLKSKLYKRKEDSNYPKFKMRYLIAVSKA